MFSLNRVKIYCPRIIYCILLEKYIDFSAYGQTILSKVLSSVFFNIIHYI